MQRGKNHSACCVYSLKLIVFVLTEEKRYCTVREKERENYNTMQHNWKYISQVAGCQNRHKPNKLATLWKKEKKQLARYSVVERTISTRLLYGYKFHASATNATKALCIPVIRPSVRPSVVCPMSTYFAWLNLSLLIVEGFQLNLPQIFIMWEEIVEKIFKVKGERLRSCGYKSVNVVVVEERGVKVCLFNLKSQISELKCSSTNCDHNWTHT